jgi:hypothetical protein
MERRSLSPAAAAAGTGNVGLTGAEGVFFPGGSRENSCPGALRFSDICREPAAGGLCPP